MLFDTCALLWSTLEPGSLSYDEKRIAFQAFEDGTAAVSSISFWEIGIKLKKKKLSIGMPLDQYIRKIHRFSGVEIIPVDELIWLENLSLDWDHRDPADRTIVATARLREVPILTRDSIIHNFYPHQGWAAL